MKGLLAISSRESSYERGIYIFLSTFRFSSYALAVGLTFSIWQPPPTDQRMILILGLVGAYTIWKILFRFRLWRWDFLTYTILAADLAAGVALVLLTGGADSPFLLYSLLPIITAALFFGERLTLIIAALTSLNLVLAQTVLAAISPDFVPILQGNYLTIVVLYGIFCFLIATITYRTNFNVYRHIQSEAIVEERRRLRREIHDGIAQVLGYLGTKTNLIKKSLPASDETLLAELDEMHQAIQTSYEDIREDIDHLDMEAKAVSLPASLASHTEQLGKRAGVTTEFIGPDEPLALHPTAQLQLLRIAQEALNNVRRHASASQVSVRLEKTPRGIELVVKDDGRGFTTSEPRGTGLRIMEERAGSISGILTVISAPGEGTEIRVNVPWR